MALARGMCMVLAVATGFSGVAFALDESFYEDDGPVLDLPGVYRATDPHASERSWGDSFAVYPVGDREYRAVPLYFGDGVQVPAAPVHVGEDSLRIRYAIRVAPAGQRHVRDRYAFDLSYRNRIYDGWLDYQMDYLSVPNAQPYQRRVPIRLVKAALLAPSTLQGASFAGSWVDGEGASHDLHLLVHRDAVTVRANDRTVRRPLVTGPMQVVRLRLAHRDHPWDMVFGAVDPDTVLAVAIPTGDATGHWAVRLHRVP